MLYSLATLEPGELEAIQSLETLLGKRVLALRKVDVELDDLSEEDVAEIQQLEVTTGLLIVAVK